jgi:hypothetical protein
MATGKILKIHEFRAPLPRPLWQKTQKLFADCGLFDAFFG